MTVPTGVPLEPADVYPRSVTKLRSAVTPDVPQLPVEHRQTLPVTALGLRPDLTSHRDSEQRNTTLISWRRTRTCNM